MDFHRPPSPQVQEQIYLLCRGLIHALASRFAGRGESQEDLRQVACIGLLKAMERFDATLGRDFIGFAAPTMVGEIKRHLRDRTALLKSPRRLQEFRNVAATASEGLTQALGRSPTGAELAEVMGASREMVLQSLEAETACRPVSLHASHRGDKDTLAGSVQDSLGVIDLGFEEAENRVMLERALAELTLRERVVLFLRFHQSLSQAETAQFLGTSQVQVSRLQHGALLRLRESLSEGARAAWARFRGSGKREPADASIRSTVVQWLLQEAGSGAGPRRLSSTAARLYRKLRDRLSQVIGQDGADAVLARARSRIDSLLPGTVDEMSASEGESDEAARFETFLGRMESPRLQETTATFFVTFCTLLSGIIGERLAMEILRGPQGGNVPGRSRRSME